MTWSFSVADVSQPILGADFLEHHGLLVDMKGKRIIDPMTSFSSLADSTIEPSSGISTASNDSGYRDLLNEFKNITLPSRNQEIRSKDVFHHILTEGPPVAQRARRLTPEKLKDPKVEFDYMLSHGIFRPSNPQHDEKREWEMEALRGL